MDVPRVQPHTLQKKSDLNVPENEIVEPKGATAIPFEQKKIHDQQQQQSNIQNVSNFFAYDNNNKVNEQVSALSFFEVKPETNSQPVIDCFGLDRQKQVESHNNSLNAINFFTLDVSKASSHEEMQQQCTEIENTSIEDDHNNKEGNMDEDDIVGSNKKDEVQEFNSPITSSTIQGNDSINDMTDKLESLSACSRSTLSLFATSELDSTMGKLLPSAPFESLIPKYLEQQPLIGDSMKRESLSDCGRRSQQKYRPIYCHWFYQNLYWHPFSMSDSMKIDQAIINGDGFVYTSGGRYEVNITDRRRSSIYWTSGSNMIRKCSWFYMDEKNGNQNLIPYDEGTSELLEKEYEKTINSGSWNHKVYIPNSKDFVVMKNAENIEHHKMEQILVVKRGVDEFDIDDGEEGTPDHLILCISGFGDKIDENG